MPISVAFCADRNVIESLHATLKSLLDSSSSDIDVYVICVDWTSANKKALQSEFEHYSRQLRLHLLDFSVGLVNQYLDRQANGLHGNYVAYVRLFLPDLLVSLSKVIYLDCDLIITTGLDELWNLDLAGKYLAGVEGGILADSIDCSFLLQHGVAQATGYFNSGVLVMDLDGWRQNDITRKILELTKGKALPSHDQTALNYFFHGDYARFPGKYNFRLYPQSNRIDNSEYYSEKRIYHFVGSPKPWDLFGSIIHRNHYIYADVAKQITITKVFSAGTLMRSIARAWRIRKSYVRTVKFHFMRFANAR